MRVPIILAIFLAACASPKSGRKRFLIGGGIGGAGGAVAGYTLSPNEESRVLNSVVFGLTGALVGGLAGMLLYGEDEIPAASNVHPSSGENGSLNFVPDQNKELPTFLRNRFRPAVIEEFVERDQIHEDGSISEPHKVYRIKRPAEILVAPAAEAKK